MSIFDRAPEILEALRCCENGCSGERCSYYGIASYGCIKKLTHDAAELICALQSELARATAERDAAVADLKHGDNCDICKHNNITPEGCNFECVGCKLDGCGCNKCRNESNWEWRGLQSDNKGQEERQ